VTETSGCPHIASTPVLGPRAHSIEDRIMGYYEFVGVDGCRAGWFSIGLNRNGECGSRVDPDFNALLEHYAEAELILMDIPIGLLEGRGRRACDQAAKDTLGWPRNASVFWTPTRFTVKRAVEHPRDRLAADAVEREYAHSGLSVQAFSIAPKIGQVDRIMVHRREGDIPKIREVHPEVCFWALHGAAMRHSKKTPIGREERLQVLEVELPNAIDIYNNAIGRFLRKDVARDDIIDALVAAVTALRPKDGVPLQTLPEKSPLDPRDIHMEMVFWRAPQVRR
jgi:predicted RNase H-like nuclease